MGGENLFQVYNGNMRTYKAWFYFVFALLAAIASVLSLALFGYWFAQAYKGNDTLLLSQGPILLLAFAILAFVQVGLYSGSLLMALSLPKVHRFSRRIFRWWIGAAVVTLLLVLVLLPNRTFWEALPLFYPPLSLLTAVCALLSLQHSARKQGKR